MTVSKLAQVLLALACLSSFGQTLPQIVHSGPYIFDKEWVDDFNQKENRWYFADWTFDANECEFNALAGSFDNGKLKLSILEKTAGNMGNHPSKPYWGAEYWTAEEFKYGRYVIRMKPYTPSGTVTSFFTSHIDWNNDYTVPLEWYEIDVEFAGKTNEVEFTLHWIDETGKHQDSHIVPLGFDASAASHEWVVEWTPTFIKYYVDNQLLFTFDDPDLLAEQDHAQAIQMNYWVSNAEGWVGPFNPSGLPIATEYDYLAYYSLTNPLVTSHPESKEPVTLHLYPNPCNEYVQIGQTEDQPTSFRITAMDGKTVQEGKTENGKIVFTTRLQTGIYAIELEGSNEKIKLVVE